MFRLAGPLAEDAAVLRPASRGRSTNTVASRSIFDLRVWFTAATAAEVYSHGSSG